MVLVYEKVPPNPWRRQISAYRDLLAHLAPLDLDGVQRSGHRALERDRVAFEGLHDTRRLLGLFFREGDLRRLDALHEEVPGDGAGFVRRYAGVPEPEESRTDISGYSVSLKWLQQAGKFDVEQTNFCPQKMPINWRPEVALSRDGRTGFS